MVSDKPFVRYSILTLAFSKFDLQSVYCLSCSHVLCICCYYPSLEISILEIFFKVEIRNLFVAELNRVCYYEMWDNLGHV